MFKLTKRAVEGLETRDRDYFIWDSDMRGFGLRVYPSGKKTYLIQYRTGRRTRRIHHRAARGADNRGSTETRAPTAERSGAWG